MMREIWLPVVEFEGTYEVSNTGKIRRLATKGKPGSGNYARSAHEIKPHKNNKGYLIVDLWQENKRKQKLLHRVVAEAFIPNPKNLPEVNHKDENPQNCFSANLEWCTRLYNMNYGTFGARIAKSKGKCVKQCDQDGVVVNTFPSIMEAQRKTGISQGSIGDCLHGRRKRAGGYLWHYAK